MLRPKRPLSAFMRFFIRKYLLEQPTKPASLEEIRSIATKCSLAWKELSHAEKQVLVWCFFPSRCRFLDDRDIKVYFDQYAAEWVEHEQRLAEWFESLDRAVLRALNERRTK